MPEAVLEQRYGQKPMKVKESRECGIGGLSRQEGRAGALTHEAGV